MGQEEESSVQAGLVVQEIRCIGHTLKRDSSRMHTITVTCSSSDELFLRASCENMFSVVSDVDSYKDFLPYCKDSRVLSKRGNMYAS